MEQGALNKKVSFPKRSQGGSNRANPASTHTNKEKEEKLFVKHLPIIL
jgi:hypothetical protein